MSINPLHPQGCNTWCCDLAEFESYELTPEYLKTNEISLKDLPEEVQKAINWRIAFSG
jgi:hypothetical protein